MDVEIGEENNEGDGVAYQSVLHPLGEVAINVESICSVDDAQRELQLCRERETSDKPIVT